MSAGPSLNREHEKLVMLNLMLHNKQAIAQAGQRRKNWMIFAMRELARAIQHEGESQS